MSLHSIDLDSLPNTPLVDLCMVLLCSMLETATILESYWIYCIVWISVVKWFERTIEILCNILKHSNPQSIVICGCIKEQPKS